MAELGSVNPEGEEEYARQLARRKFYEGQVADLAEARKGLETIISDIDRTMESRFTEAFRKINEEFGRIMQLMFRGGKARLELTDEAHPLEGGVEMYLQLPGKKRQPLSLMSGGERALTVIALLISFMAYRPAPFCFVDEIDAALDDANVERYSRMIGEYKRKHSSSSSHIEKDDGICRHPAGRHHGREGRLEPHHRENEGLCGVTSS